jgi:uncharacterized OB-fold protein
MADQIPIREDMFTEGREGTVLLANKCTACGKVHFPKAQLCLTCLHKQLEDMALNRRGKLFSYTVVHMPSSHFQPPYAVGYVDLPEGVRVFSQLEITEDKPFKVNMDMEVITDTLWHKDGKEVVGFRFAPL